MSGSAYIFGGGRSVLDLTPAEREYLNRHPRTLAMNRFLLHWEMTRVLPKASLLMDRQFPSQLVLVDLMRKARSASAPVHLYIHSDYRAYLGSSPRDLARGLRRRARIWRAHRSWVPYVFARPPITYVDQGKHSPLEQPIPWATGLDEPLYWYRSTLTVAINLAALLYPGTDIKLIGVDMGFASFFESEVQDPAIIASYSRTELHRRAQEMDVSSTVMPLDDGTPGILAALPKVREVLQRDGRELYCCNPQSMLVTEGICPYAPVMDSP